MLPSHYVRLLAQKGLLMMHAEHFAPHQMPPMAAQPEPSETEIEAFTAQIDAHLPRNPIFWLDYARLNVRRKVYELKIVSREY